MRLEEAQYEQCLSPVYSCVRARLSHCIYATTSLPHYPEITTGGYYWKQCSRPSISGYHCVAATFGDDGKIAADPAEVLPALLFR